MWKVRLNYDNLYAYVCILKNFIELNPLKSKNKNPITKVIRGHNVIVSFVNQVKEGL